MAANGNCFFNTPAELSGITRVIFDTRPQDAEPLFPEWLSNRLPLPVREILSILLPLDTRIFFLPGAFQFEPGIQAIVSLADALAFQG